MDESRRVDKASDILGRLLDRGMLTEGKRWFQVFRRWETIVGPRAAAHSRLVDVTAGRAVVEADHPGWIQVLQEKSSEIIAGINRIQPSAEVRTLRIRLGDLHDRDQAPVSADSRPGSEAPFEGEAVAATAKHEQPPLPPSPEDAVTEGRLLDSIEDDELRRSLSGLRDAVRRREAERRSD